MECFSKIQTFLLFNLLGLRPVLSALETFKAFLADFPTVFLALPPTTTFQPFSRPQWTGHSTVFQAWLLGCSMLYSVTLFGFLIVPCFTIFTKVLHDPFNARLEIIHTSSSACESRSGFRTICLTHLWLAIGKSEALWQTLSEAFHCCLLAFLCFLLCFYFFFVYWHSCIIQQQQL